MIYKAFQDLQLSQLGFGTMRPPMIWSPGSSERPSRSQLVEKPGTTASSV